MNCSSPGCTNAPSHEFAFPGGPLQYICEEHRAGRDGINIVDPLTTSSMVARFMPIGGEPTEPAAEIPCTMCGARDPLPAVATYKLTADDNSQIDNSEGHVCAKHLIRLYEQGKATGMHVEARELTSVLE